MSPLPIQEEDGHQGDDASQSVSVPSDLAPFKQAAEVGAPRSRSPRRSRRAGTSRSGSLRARNEG